jgi:uncharacterized membrane protein (UPF0127 family)
MGLIVGVMALGLMVLFVYSYRTPPTPAPPLPSGWVAGEFGGVSLSLELATSSVAQQRGLGGRTEVPEGTGMLFVFAIADNYGFWMQDTLIPLDIFWLDDRGQVISIAKDVATSTYPTVFYPAAPARYVLETAAGFSDSHTIATGTPLTVRMGLQNLQ